MTGGLLLESISVIAFGFLNLAPGYRAFVALAFVLRIAQGLGSAAYSTASTTIVMSEFTNNLGIALSSLKTAYSVGMTLGCSIGGFLFELGGFSLPFMVCGSMEIICVIVSIFVIPDTADKQSATTSIFKQFWTDPMVYLFGAVTFGSSICIGFNQATLEPHLRQFGLSPSVMGLLYMTHGMLWCVTIPVWGLLCDRNVNSTLLCVVGCFLMCIYLTFIGPAPFLPLSPKLWLVIMSLAFFGAGFGGSYTCAMIACLQHTLRRGFEQGTGTHGVVSSMITVFMSLGASIGPALGGALMEHVGYSWGTMVLLSLEAAVTALLMTAYVRKSCLQRATETGSSTDVDSSEGCNVLVDNSSVLQKATSGTEASGCYGSCDAEWGGAQCF